MKKVLILGAGMVVKPIVQNLLQNEIFVTIASPTKFKGDSMIGGHHLGKSLYWTASDEETLEKLILENDLTVSLLPYSFHIMVANYCIKHKKNMLTTSYVQAEMQALDKKAKDAGIIILNELGLDPGIDHMSAMRIIDYIHEKGGKVEEFYSICGALPAKENSDNPFKYKFSWSPKGVVLAGNNNAKYLKHGKIIDVPTENLFKDVFKVDFPGIGNLEVYPNRDSLEYIDIYKIPETKTIFRGTFRFKGWCETFDAMKTLNLTIDKKIDFSGKSYADFLAMQIGETSSDNIKEKVANYLKIEKDATAIKSMEFLGLFSNEKINRKEDTSFELTSDLMIDKMMLKENEKDMILMEHTFLAKYPDGKQEVIKSRMLDFGSPKTNTSVARTVALPAAIGVKMILENKIKVKGVWRPIIPEIYNPILDALEDLDIKMVEDYNLPISENI